MQMVQTLPSRRGISLLGIGCGIGAGALWGLVFLAPELAGMFRPLELTIGRYIAYGLIALIAVAPRLRRLVDHIGGQGLIALVWLSLAGNTVYYFLLSAAVQMGGIAMTSLIIGFLPVAVTIIGSRDHDAVPLIRLVPSLLLCAGGGLCIGWQAVGQAMASHSFNQLIGMACATGALISWTVYAVGNARWLVRLHTIGAQDWNLLIGVMTGAQALCLVPVALMMGVAHHSGADWSRFLIVSGGVALLASIAGNALWNRASRLLPLTLVGQMILFETLFALLYGFLWEARWPTMAELGAFGLLVASITACLAAHRGRGKGQGDA